MAASLRVLVADDHAILRAGIRLLLTAQRDIEVVGEASSGPQALDLALRTNADVLLMDLSMPGGGIAAIEALRVRVPTTRCLALTMHADGEHLRAVLAAGGWGYVLKSSGNETLLSAVRSVARAELFIDPSFGAEAHLGEEGSIEPGTRRDLSEREREVLVALAEGHTNARIAETMGISVKTVETYRTRIAEKLGLKTRPEIVRYALEVGLLSRTV